MDKTLETLRRELTGSLTGLSTRQTQVRPAEERWSIQQIAEHLLLSYATTCAVVDTRLAKGVPTKARATPAQRLGQLLIVRFGWFPKGRKAPPAVSPPREPERLLSGAELAVRVEGDLAAMDARLAQAAALFGRDRAISHVVLGPMAAADWRRFHLVHGRHHLRQIASLRAAGGA